MAAGTVTGDASIGTDLLTEVESIRGTNFADTYVATGFNGASSDFPATFNEFEGMAGNDIITGNGNTRISYVSAAAGVTVTLSGTGSGSAQGIASGDLAGVGIDTFTGVGAVRGSGFADTFNTGDANNNTFNGGAGFDQVSYQSAVGSISVNLAAGTVSGGASVGTDTLRSIEYVFGTNASDTLRREQFQ